jgi:hypothetical protein
MALTGLTVASQEFERLNFYGARLISPQARRELIDRIQDTPDEEPRFQVATRLGWHRHAFVLPDGVISADSKKLWVHLDDGGRRERFDRFRTGGTLACWQEIARLAVGNSRLELLLCLAFVGPVAALLGSEQPAIMLVGPAEAGKSTALVAAGSVWGRHADPNMANKLGFCLPFNATDNDLEDEALAANHTLLAVDETRAAGGGGERKIAEFLGSPAFPVLRVVVPGRNEHIECLCSLRSPVLVRARSAICSGRAAGSADPAVPRPSHHRRRAA